MKMYILVKRSLESHKVVGVAHGVLMAHLKFYSEQELVNNDYLEWLKTSFKKVICEVSDEEFEMAKSFDNRVIVTESSLGGKEIAMVFCPRREWPEPFKKYPLMKI